MGKILPDCTLGYHVELPGLKVTAILTARPRMSNDLRALLDTAPHCRAEPGTCDGTPDRTHRFVLDEFDVLPGGRSPDRSPHALSRACAGAGKSHGADSGGRGGGPLSDVPRLRRGHPCRAGLLFEVAIGEQNVQPLKLGDQ